MTLSGKMLNTNATLNSFKVVGSIDFIPGSNLKLNIMIFNPEESIRYIPPSTVIPTFTFPGIDADVVKIATFLADDRSIMTVNLTQAETEQLTGGNFTFVLDELGDGTQLSEGYVSLGLRRITNGEPCC